MTPSTIAVPARVPEWTLGDRLRKARTSAGLGQRELAAYLGMSQAVVAQYETGRRRPRLGVVRLWSLRTGVDIDWLLQGEGPDPEGGSAPASTKWLRRLAA